MMNKLPRLKSLYIN